MGLKRAYTAPKKFEKDLYNDAEMLIIVSARRDTGTISPPHLEQVHEESALKKLVEVNKHGRDVDVAPIRRFSIERASIRSTSIVLNPKT